VNELRKVHPEVEVTAIDSGPERERYQGRPGVRMIPPVPYERMPELINAHDIVLGQFGIGSLGMSELESMACACPVVCYADVQESYSDPPPVFSTQDPQKAAEYLATLIEDPALRQQTGQSSREWVERCHGHIAIARQLEQVYLSSRPYGS
jgi:glycosyltransferase involved in cell wall biosynthesis